MSEKQLLSGWLVIDKPLGVTSTKIGSIIKRALGLNKIGHIGTLDPLASGVLTLALEEATKAIPYYHTKYKTYDFEITWGEKRDTHDREGKIVEVSSNRPTLEQIQSQLTHFIGCIEQVPPQYSAVKVKGRRAYEMARKGTKVELKPRLITIHSFDVLLWINSDKCQFRVVCGSGTYIRSLCRDLAIALDTVGYISELRRIQDGKFTIKDTISLEKFKEIAHKESIYQFIKPIRAVLDDIPAVSLSASDVDKLRHGQKIKADNAYQQPFVLLCEDEQLAAIALFEEGYWHPKRVFNYK